MSKDRLEKIRKFKARRPKGGGGARLRGIFHTWKDGPNTVRLVGDFLEVRTHFIAPVPKRNERGVCRQDAFAGDEKISMIVNCPDWDIEKSEEKATKTCPVCKLNTLAHAVLQEECNDEEKKYYENLRRIARQTINLKWNILDRDDPYVLQVDEGDEKKVKALKIAGIGMEAWGDIEGIYDQMAPIDIADDVEGLDICVTRGKAARVTYSAAAVLDTTTKPPSVKMSPLSPEEKALAQHDLKAICGKQTDIVKVMDALHEDYREHLELNEEEAPEAATENTASDDESAAAAAAIEEAAKPEAEEPKAEKKEEPEVKKAPVETEDEDSLVASSPRRTPVKKN